MTDFEYIVGFYALLLGLAVADVAIGFADMWRDRDRRKSGWCAPLIAGAVLLGSMNIWLSTWATRSDIVVDAWQMIAALGICLPYVFVARAMHPPEGSAIGLEDHYLANRIPILSALAIAPAISVWSKIRLDHFHFGELEECWLIARFFLPLALILIPSRAIQRAGLGVLNLLLVAGLFRYG